MLARSLALAVYLSGIDRLEGRVRRHLAARAARGKEDPARLGERMGRPGLARPSGQLVWFHAASVGEALSLVELIRRLRARRPALSVLVTTGTVTSAGLLAERLPEGAFHQYAPVDLRRAVRAFLQHWRPDLAVWTESELWPSLVVETHASDVPMLLVNARMSARAHRGWRWMPSTAATLLGRFRLVLAQEEATARRLRRLGVPRDRLEVTGTLKEGTGALPCDEGERAMLASQITGRPVWLAASTHPGEEELVIDAHRQAARAALGLLLILAPRHPERGDALEEMLRTAGLVVARRSRGELPGRETEVFLADTMGEMGLWYRLAPVSFVGGSLVEVGGHNAYEPAALGSAILHGPHVANFADIYQRLAAARAAVRVADARSLARAVTETLAPARAAALAHAAWEAASSGAEVTDRVIAAMLEHLDGAGGA
ncbi:MAG: 3-deoxy-D-manno-octulosonic acid transferase [Rhodobacteraceae bacterium]|nr:3-deoxy-D-manno-octulosonic acid transferase [Paracoccaceae bacterium]